MTHSDPKPAASEPKVCPWCGSSDSAMRLPREPGVVCNNGFFHPPEAFAARQTDPKPAASENEPRPETTKDVYERAGKRRNDPPERFITKDEFLAAAGDEYSTQEYSTDPHFTDDDVQRAAEVLDTEWDAGNDSPSRAVLAAVAPSVAARERERVLLDVEARIREQATAAPVGSMVWRAHMADLAHIESARTDGMEGKP